MEVKRAFTIAELLIVLSIVGIIAQTTIPSLIQEQQERQTVTRLKKVYSMLSSAYTLAAQANGTPDNWGLSLTAPGLYQVLIKIKPYLSISKDCSGGQSGCFAPGVGYKCLAHDDCPTEPFFYDTLGYATAQLSDNTLLYGTVSNVNCALDSGDGSFYNYICGYYLVDINGAIKPNVYGKDLFIFFLTKNGIFPAGAAQQTVNSFSIRCKNKNTQSGTGCAGWVIFNENMDYLHCNDLDWNIKNTCS